MFGIRLVVLVAWCLVGLGCGFSVGYFCVFCLGLGLVGLCLVWGEFWCWVRFPVVFKVVGLRVAGFVCCVFPNGLVRWVLLFVGSSVWIDGTWWWRFGCVGYWCCD